ncbi:MAG: HlyU family transcriptional regulator [Pseudomonadota bacterium]
MPLFSKLFGGSQKEPEPEVYNDFRIFAEPMSEGGSFRMAARIEKDVGGETKTHLMIRADTFKSRDDAVEASIAKAKHLIDQQGVSIFG